MLLACVFALVFVVSAAFLAVVVVVTVVVVAVDFDYLLMGLLTWPFLLLQFVIIDVVLVGFLCCSVVVVIGFPFDGLRACCSGTLVRNVSGRHGSVLHARIIS